MAEKEESAALFCADPSAQPEIQEVSGSLDSGEPKWIRSACQDQVLLRPFLYAAAAVIWSVSVTWQWAAWLQ